MRTLRMLTMLLTAFVLALPALAQDFEEPGGLVEDEDRARIESADHLRYDPAEAMYYLDGNVVFSHRNIKLYCESAVYDYDNNSAVATGNPRIVEPETTITGEIIEANFDDEVATISRNVTAVTQKKPEGGEEAADEDGRDDDAPPRDLAELHEKKTTITCEKIVHEYADDVKRTTATGRVKAVQEDKTVYADMAVYEEIEEIITLTGDVRILTDRGDELRCPKAVISVEENWIRAENVQVVGKRRNSDGEQEQPRAEPPPAQEQPSDDGAATDSEAEGG
ncbi:MAG: OstA-like protein [Armatimonadota bacterium]|jgi:lipopolysaccharide assembly outer membrane protein LptD (OstA)